MGADLLGLDPARCLAFEDAPAGVASANAAGCPTVGLLSTHSPDEMTAATAIATDLSAVAVSKSTGGALTIAVTTSLRP